MKAKLIRIRDTPTRTLLYRPLSRRRPSGVSGVLAGYIRNGRRFLYALALLLALKLSAQPHIVGISPPFGDPFFGTNVYVFAEQLANKSVTIEGAPAPNFQSTYTLAFYACYTERQTVVATAPFSSAFQYFRARNDPCNEALAVPQEIVDSRLCVPCHGVLWQLYEIVTAVPHRDGETRRFVAEPLLQL